MNNRTILALAGLAMLSLSAVSIIGLSSGSSVQAQSPQSNHNSNTTVTIVNNNVTIDDIKQQLHAQLDGAIMAAQNNDTFGVLMELGKITEGLAAINTPSYFLFEGPLPNNGTTLANTSETSATGSNQGTTTTTTSAASPNNQSDTIGGEGAGSANTTSSAVGTDSLGSE
jgi:hypothetical protein